MTNRDGRTGRPPLTERRKAATRLEIAREAVRLFTANGVAATSAEEIAAAAGISARTLWRYFPNKESCVEPMLTAGIDMTRRALGTWSPGGGVAGLLDELERNNRRSVADLPVLLDLVRLTRTEPGLRAVWLRAHADAEPVFAAEVGRGAGLPGEDLSVRVRAVMINSALRVAVEHYAFHTDPAHADEAGVIDAVRAALLTVDRGLAE
ncbi:TetR/AcrR family transcriptional regulator [Qaidamihabitans albus]|uniref:TetR/AcrR family transcriptional regulator n=1 Tax=Qaidamihabitans albus TaxID=2795733 RepID=UPI0018F1EF3B|nr:TetR/AcrR family transcriptional regulator [Qaidamihabitans albus]